MMVMMVVVTMFAVRRMAVVVPPLVFRHSSGVVFPSLEPERLDEYFQYAVEM